MFQSITVLLQLNTIGKKSWSYPPPLHQSSKRDQIFTTLYLTPSQYQWRPCEEHRLLAPLVVKQCHNTCRGREATSTTSPIMETLEIVWEQQKDSLALPIHVGISEFLLMTLNYHPDTAVMRNNSTVTLFWVKRGCIGTWVSTLTR